MPRISLYRPERSNDYKFIDRQISEMFQAGGTDVYLHKYIGTEARDENGNIIAKSQTQIQDLMFLENRDRKYDEEIYRIRGIYNVSNIDFNLSQFGLFIDNDTVYMTVHINDFIKYIGRKPLSGDVMELPHLRDDFALDEIHDISLPRYYVIDDVGRASEGFSSTWFPHLYRLKLRKITDGQQFADILNKPALDSMGDPDASGTTLKDLLSTYNFEIGVNQAIIAEAELSAKASGYETAQFYTLAVDPATGKPAINTVDQTELLASNPTITALETNKRPLRTGYTGYLVSDGKPSNGYSFGHGIQFPDNPVNDDYFLRTDFLPSRLFRFDSTRWVKMEDNVRMTMTNNDTRQTLKTGFINNSTYIYNEAVGVDWMNIDVADTVITTNINYATAMYLVFKLDTVELAYVIADNAGIVTNVAGKLRINLPVVDEVQQTLPYSGLWKISLCNHRDAQKQSLSNALKYRPEADL